MHPELNVYNIIHLATLYLFIPSLLYALIAG